MPHANAPLTPKGRLIMCRRVEAGRPIAHVATEMGISRQTASKWWGRYLTGDPGNGITQHAPSVLSGRSCSYFNGPCHPWRRPRP